MSLRTKKQELLDRAAEKRDKWTPVEGTRHLELYRAYRKRHGITTSKYGRCEYFHRVGRQFLYEQRAKIRVMLGIVAAALLVWLFVVFTPTLLTITALILFVFYAIFGAGVSLHVLSKRFPKHFRFESIDWLDSRPKWLYNLLTVLVIPVGIILLAVMGLLGLVTLFLAFVTEGKVSDFAFRKQLFKQRGLTWVRSWMFVALGFVILGQFTVPEFYRAYIVGGMIAGGIVLVVGVLFLAFFVDEKLKDHRRHVIDDYDKRRTAYAANGAARRLFAYYNPECVVDGVATIDERKFAIWLTEYDQHCKDNLGGPYDELRFWSHFGSNIDRETYEQLFGETITATQSALIEEFEAKFLDPTAHPKRPWYQGIIDTLSFVGAFVLTIKSKFCPLLELPESAKSE